MGSRSRPVVLSCVFGIFLVPALFGGVDGLQITDLRVPQIVKNGSEDSVVLDCPYTFEDFEASSLVVSWFFNGMPVPVYQWIPPKKPQDLGVLKGKLNLDYRASDNEMTMHRALQILNPTTDLSGEYKCKVSSFEDEDFMSKKMIVFAPEKDIQLTQFKPKPNSVNITCFAEGMYPEPKMTLYKDPNKKTKVGIVGAEAVTMARGKVYDIMVSKVMEDRELQSPTVFDCELRIPAANYTVRKNIMYYPGPPTTTTTTREPSTVPDETELDNNAGCSAAASIFSLLLTMVTLYLRL